MSSINGGWRGPNIVKDGLVLYLDAGSPNSFFSETAGTTWKDISGNGLNGTLTNGPTFSSADGGSIVFDGSNDYVDCGTNTILDFGVGSATISCWFKTSTSIGAIISKRQIAGFQVYVFNNKFYADGAGTAGVSSTNNVNNNIWTHGTAVYDRSGALLRLYVNGTPNNTTALGSTSLTDTSRACTIGRTFFSGPDYFIGNITLVQLYNRALSATEVLQNFNATRARFGI